MQKERKWSSKTNDITLTIKQSQGPSSRAINNILSHVLRAVLQILKPSAGGRSKLCATHKHAHPRLVGARRLMMLIPTYITTDQSEECPRAHHALLLEHCKTPYYPLQGGTHSLEDIRPPLPGKAIQLFLSTSPKTLSPRFNPAPMYSGQILATGLTETHSTCNFSRAGVWRVGWMNGMKISVLRWPLRSSDRSLPPRDEELGTSPTEAGRPETTRGVLSPSYTLSAPAAALHVYFPRSKYPPLPGSRGWTLAQSSHPWLTGTHFMLFWWYVTRLNADLLRLLSLLPLIYATHNKS